MPPAIWDRFWSKVRIGGEDECWLWMAGRTSLGYGYFSIDGSHRYAHRMVFELYHSNPGGLNVLHRCDNPPCVNPGHLFLGTHADNAADREAKGRGRQLFGERHPNAFLEDQDVAEMRRLWSSGESTQPEIAYKFGVSQSHVSKICANKSRVRG